MLLSTLLVACIALVNTASAIPHPKTVILQQRSFENFMKDPAYYLKRLGASVKKPKQIKEAANDITPQRIGFFPSNKKFTTPSAEQIKALGFHFKDIWAGDPAKERYADWQIIGRLGSGGFGVVLLGYDGEKYGAIKFIDIDMSTEEEVLAEIRAQWKLRHINGVVKLYEWARHKEEIVNFYKFTVIIMEAANAGDLTHLIMDKKKLDPKLTQELFKELAQALKQCHAAGLALRDVKPDNVLLFKDTKGKLTPKFADFGLSTPIKSETFDARGTLGYLAPEAIATDGSNKAIYNNHPNGKTEYVKAPTSFDLGKVDVYALGMTLYQMLGGMEAARPVDIPEAGMKEIKGVNFDDPTFKAIDPKIRTLLEGMLHDDPQKRFGIDDVVNSEWLK